MDNLPLILLDHLHENQIQSDDAEIEIHKNHPRIKQQNPVEDRVQDGNYYQYYDDCDSDFEIENENYKQRKNKESDLIALAPPPTKVKSGQSSLRNPLSLNLKSNQNQSQNQNLSQNQNSSLSLNFISSLSSATKGKKSILSSETKSKSIDECNAARINLNKNKSNSTSGGRNRNSLSDICSESDTAHLWQGKRLGVGTTTSAGSNKNSSALSKNKNETNKKNDEKELISQNGNDNHQDHFPLIFNQVSQEQERQPTHHKSTINSKSISKRLQNRNSIPEEESRSVGGGFIELLSVKEPEPVPVPVRRMSLFKAFTRRNNSQSKHKKLNEGGWLVGEGGDRGSGDLIVRGVTFYVKFLGSALMEKVGSAEAAEAVKTVIGMVKAGRKSARVGLTVSSSGIRIVNGSNGEVTSHISIYDIAHCSSDANYPNVFSFIATNKNETNECYCFASPKRKMAQKVTLTIAEAFNLAFEMWQNSCVAKQSVHLSSEKVVRDDRSPSREERQWVHFDDDGDDVDGLNDHLENIHLRTYSINRQRRQDSLEDHDPGHHSDHEDLLICLN